MKKILLPVLAIIIAITVGAYFLSQSRNTSSSLKGVTFTPKSFGGADFTDFLNRTKQTGQVVSWVGDWNDLGNPQSGAYSAAGSAKAYGYQTMIILTVSTLQPSYHLLRPLSESVKNQYVSKLSIFLKKYPVPYLGIGNEINFIYESSDFDSFVDLFSRAAAEAKKVSPNTKIFTGLQLERTKGMRGGLWGGQDNAAKNEWAILDKFRSADAIGFTTYPGLNYRDPNDVPADYYSDISGHTAQTVYLTEVGWTSGTTSSGWESSPDEQSRFITKFFSLTAGLPNKISIWSFMVDQNTALPFNSMGLLDKNGREKSAWQTWVSAK